MGRWVITRTNSSSSWLPRFTLATSLIVSCVLLANPASGQQTSGTRLGFDQGATPGGDRLVLPRLTGEIRLDGVVDEAAWDAIEPLPLTMFSPTFGAPMTERTEIRIAYDERYLYASGRFYDSDPDGIRTNTFYRDQYSGDDIMAVVLDSYNDYETAVWFVANPAGARTDRSVSNDAVFSGGMPMNSDWNAHWDVATTQTEDGWFAEFRIPFSTLGFQSIDGDVTMGLAVYRFIPRKNERQLYPAIDPSWGGLAFAKPSQMQRVSLQGIEPSKPVYVTPYLLGGFNQAPSFEVESGWRTERNTAREIGADLRFSPSSNLALDVTINTDFAQVEADAQQINLTRFSLFFPEKRQFFQERSSTFDFNTGGFFNRLFHSRSIGLVGGQAVRIYGGARAVGRLGGTDFGFLNMQTAARDGRSSENMGVLRVNQQILNPFSSVGAMMTSRLGSNGEDNLAYGLDAVLRLVGDEYLTVKWAQTFDEKIEEESALESGLFLARWERQKDGGLSYSGSLGRIGSDYRPRLGFQLRRDVTTYEGKVQYKSFRDATSPLRSWLISSGADHFRRNEDQTAESRSIEPAFEIEFKSGAQIRIRARRSYESVRREFRIADAVVPEGNYWFADGEARFQLPRSGLLRGDLTLTAGNFYDGTRVGGTFNPSWTASKYLELGGAYEVNRITFEDRGMSTTAHVGRLKVQIALDTRVSLSTFVQYSNVADLTSLNARFRYHFREGTDLWIVFNEGLNTERTNGVDQRFGALLPRSAGRNLTVKYSHALIW